MVTCDHVLGLCKQAKVQQKNETLLFESYSKKNTFGVIKQFSAPSISILKIIKFC